ncbi:hypothetical protein [Tenacibaculum sp. 190524A02b]|uniref:Uncharacterized protein n=1 Tax=Tenacibaculum vairaonense TaxID=3137860 RepID=A0ABM9PLV1_9FLAO
MSVSHSFSVQIATEYDVVSALLLQHFCFWYLKNKGDNHQFFKGKYWVRMKVATLREYFPYLTERQLRYALDKLESEKLLCKGEFNLKKNDRTKWYSFTKKGAKLLKISSDKIVSNRTDKIVNKVTNKIVTPTDKIVNSIYKEEDIEYIYIIIKEKLESNKQLLEFLAMSEKLKVATIENVIELFARKVVSIKQNYNNDKELYTHFSNWVRKQKLTDVNCEEEVTWFINVFNQISKRTFVVTDELRQLFSVQYRNGFTGKQMAKAVENMYSSNVKNTFHLKSSFKFATPEYLLKEGNLNKYLNLKY